MTIDGGAYRTGAAPFSLATGDLDGDDRPDIVVANFESNDVSVLLQHPHIPGRFFGSGFLDAGDGPLSVAIGDLNQDGRPDVTVANHYGDNVSVHSQIECTGIGFADPYFLTAGDGPASVAVADLNGDTRLDIAVANYDSGDATLLIRSRVGKNRRW